MPSELCAKCHNAAEKIDKRLFCKKCNKWLCDQCHTPVPERSKVCSKCGHENPISTPSSSPLKRQVTQQQFPYSGVGSKSASNREITPDTHQQRKKCQHCGSSKINPKTGTCRDCGQIHSSRPFQTAQPAVSTPPAPFDTSQTTTQQKAQVQQSAMTRETGLQYQSTKPSATQTPHGPPLGRAGPRLPKISIDEDSKWNLIRAVVVLLLALIGGSAYYGFSHLKNSSPPSTYSDRSATISASTSAKICKLTVGVEPAGTGQIRATAEGEMEALIFPPLDTVKYNQNDQIRLIAEPDDCHTFSYWDGASGSSETATITMDSHKSVTAHFKPKDTTPPAISEVKITSYSDVSTTVTWLTDNPATSEVEYGKTKEYGESKSSGDNLTTSHKVRLTALQPSTTYHLILRSTECGKEATGTTMLTTLRKIPVGGRVGERAPDFTLTEYQDDNQDSPNDGEHVSLRDFQDKIVLINFWSTSCGPCLKESPLIRETYQNDPCNKNTGNIAVITIGIDSQPDRIKLLEDKYQSEYGRFTFPILLDTKENPAKDAYGIFRVPTTFFIDTDGIIREIKLGRFGNKEEIEAILESLD